MVEHFCLSCLLSMLKGSHILVVVLINMATIAMRFSIKPLSIIGEEAFRLLRVDQFYSALSIPSAILELA